MSWGGRHANTLVLHRLAVHWDWRSDRNDRHPADDRNVLVGLSFWGLLFANGLVHSAGGIAAGGYNTGLLTAAFLFVPLSIWVIYASAIRGPYSGTASHASHSGSRQRDTVGLPRNVSVISRMAIITIAPPIPMNGQTV